MKWRSRATITSLMPMENLLRSQKTKINCSFQRSTLRTRGELLFIFELVQKKSSSRIIMNRKNIFLLFILILLLETTHCCMLKQKISTIICQLR